MKLIVCVKQVPNTTEIRIDPATNTLIREGVESILNPFDTYAIEEAVRLKEQHGGNVTALCMGPPQAEATLREAVSLGVDDIILLSDRRFAGADTWATSLTLAAAFARSGNSTSSSPASRPSMEILHKSDPASRRIWTSPKPASSAVSRGSPPATSPCNACWRTATTACASNCRP